MDDPEVSNPFDAETWAMLPSFFEKLPQKVQINVWGNPDESFAENEAQRVAAALAHEFTQIDTAFFPRLKNYSYYPVFGIFDASSSEVVDKGVRIIGLPVGYQMTSLIAAIQAVSFQGTTLEAGTRIRLQGLDKDVQLEVLTAADDETGSLVAKSAFGLAVASPFIRTYLIMTDSFPVALVRYSVAELPHLVINGRSHIQGLVEEEGILKQIANSLKLA